MVLKRFTGSLVAAGLLLATACSGQNATLPSAGGASMPSAGAVALADTLQPADSTSILKKLTKTVQIGSTVDPKNGDQGPHSLQMATLSAGKIKKGDLLICDFSDKSGTAGNGESVELLSSTAGSKPSTFVQSSTVQGCDGAAIMSSGDNTVYVTGLTSKNDCEFDDNGNAKKCYTNPPKDPLASGYAAQPPGSKGFYSPYFNVVGDVGAGGVDLFSLGIYGMNKLYQGVSGFPVTKVSGWSTLGPSGLAYNNKNGTLFVVDGACNAVVAIDNMPNLLVQNEITVNKTCTKFTCKDKKATCGKLVKAGSPLDKPEAEAILPNGNIVVANTGSNELVEMTPTGTVLDTKVVDTSKTAGIFGLWASGSNDNNTVLYYTDSNSNTVQELEQ
jgi:hypothetical protein